jgi:hypothetical protein
MQPQHTISKALGSLKLQCMQHQRLLLTIVGSTLLHIALFSEFSITLPQVAENQRTLDMHLVQQQTRQDNLQTLSKKNELATRDKAPKAKNEAKPTQQETAQPIEPVSETENTPVNSDANSDQPVTESANTITDISEAPESNLLKAEPEVTVYQHVETEFEVMRGSNTSAAGVTKIVFNIDANGRYSIISNTQAKGLASLFFGNLTQKSEGTVTENGLKPEFYSYQYGNDAKKLQTANFNWNDGILHMHTYKGDSSANLPAGTQDFLSFMYQFMYTPPLETMQITMTNGKRLRTYSYSFEGEETITTKLGELKAIHLLKSSGDEEKTEIWLATDYQYLPVKIRKTEKDGAVIEQVVANIQTEFLHLNTK